MPEDYPIVFSICIPVFKRAEYLERLFDSISVQNFRLFEVIVTDDSPDASIQKLCLDYEKKFVIRYFKNKTTLGTPENWNQCIRFAKGEWIKIMHDDDWFSSKNSLKEYAKAIENNPGVGFFFSAFANYFFENLTTKKIRANKFRLSSLFKAPYTLLSSNVIGPPSVTIYRRDLQIFYDNKLKWLVDIDFYIRILSITKCIYLEKILVCVGLGSEQVTQDCFRKRPVEIPENFYLLNKMGIKELRNLLVFDAWWRLMRNLEIKKPSDIRESGYHGTIHQSILAMIVRQQKIPKYFLKVGITSKFLMFLLFLKERKSIK